MSHVADREPMKQAPKHPDDQPRLPTAVAMMVLGVIGFIGSHYLSWWALRYLLTLLSLCLMGLGGFVLVSRSCRHMDMSGQIAMGATLGGIAAFVGSIYFFYEEPNPSRSVAGDSSVGRGMYLMFHSPVIALIGAIADACVARILGALARDKSRQ